MTTNECSLAFNEAILDLDPKTVDNAHNMGFHKTEAKATEAGTVRVTGSLTVSF